METDEDFDRRRAAQIEDEMRAQGAATEVKVQEDYFGGDVTQREYLRDGVSYFEFKVMNEGERRRYLNKINRDVRLQRASGDAVIKSAPGDERVALFEAALVGWNLVRNGQPVPFIKNNIGEITGALNPTLLDPVEKAIRLANPWLLGDVSAEQLEEEIASLQELLAKKREEEAGKLGSSSR